MKAFDEYQITKFRILTAKALLRVNDLLRDEAQQELNAKYETLRDHQLSNIEAGENHLADIRLLHLCQTGQPFEDSE